MKKKYILFAAVCLLLIAGVLFWTPAFFTNRESPDDSALPLEQGPTATADGAADGDRETDVQRSLIRATEPDEEYRSMLALGILEHQGKISVEPSQASQDLSGGVVQIISGNYLGSGVIIEMTEETLVIASVKHLLMYGTKPEVTFCLPDGETLTAEGTLIGLSEQYDLGYLSVPVSEIGYDIVTKLRYFPMENAAFEELRAGDIVIQTGSTDGPAADVYQGTVANKWVFVSEFNSFMTMNDCIAMRGMSGGGAFNEAGQLIGIITGGDDAATVCMPVNLVSEEYAKLCG